MTSKASIREAGKAARLAQEEAGRAERDAHIVARAQHELDWADYERVMMYLPIQRQHEINTWPLVRWVWATWPGVEVCVPRVRGDIAEAVPLTPLTTYKTSSRGIMEPAEGTALEAGEPLDLVITALLGFDTRGYRVGYGGGFYDRFFTQFPAARRVGLAYESLLVEGKIPAEPHDVRLHNVITEQQLYTF